MKSEPSVQSSGQPNAVQPVRMALRLMLVRALVRALVRTLVQEWVAELAFLPARCESYRSCDRLHGLCPPPSSVLCVSCSACCRDVLPTVVSGTSLHSSPVARLHIQCACALLLCRIAHKKCRAYTNFLPRFCTFPADTEHTALVATRRSVCGTCLCHKVGSLRTNPHPNTSPC